MFFMSLSLARPKLKWINTCLLGCKSHRPSRNQRLCLAPGYNPVSVVSNVMAAFSGSNVIGSLLRFNAVSEFLVGVQKERVT